MDSESTPKAARKRSRRHATAGEDVECAVLRYLVNALSAETEDAPAIVGIAERSCDACSTDVAVLDGLVRDLTRVARSLESVSQHRLADVDIGCS